MKQLILLLLIPIFSFAQKEINVNVHQGIPYAHDAWNNWNQKTLLTSPKFYDITGAPTAIYAVQDRLPQYFADNGTSYSVSYAPAEVVRWASQDDRPRTISVYGLTVGKEYDFKFYSTRNYTHTTLIKTTKFQIGNLVDSVSSSMNKTKVIELKGVRPNSDRINIVISAPSGSLSYLNGFTIIERETVVTPPQPGSPNITLTADSLKIYFPQRVKLTAKVNFVPKKVRWLTNDGMFYNIYGADSLVAMFEPHKTFGTGEFIFEATRSNGTTEQQKIRIDIDYNPFRVHKRTHLGELGDLIIFANGEYLFSGPCTWDCNRLGSGGAPKPQFAPLVWLNTDTAGVLDTTELLNRVRGAYNYFPLRFSTKKEGPLFQEIVLTQNNEWYGGTTEGGFSYVGLFGKAKAFVFTKLLQYNLDRITYTTIHEIGHTLGLKHQSVWNGNCTLTNAYNLGNTEEAPWMGYVAPGKKGKWITGTTSWHCSDIQNDSLVIANYIKTLQ